MSAPNPPGEGPGADPARETRSAKKPWLWIALSGLLALAVVGLAVWGASAKSDADEAEAKLDAQQSAATEQSQSSEPTPQPTSEPTPAAVDDATKQKADEALDQLGEAGQGVEAIQDDIDKAQAEADKAREELENAGGVLDRIEKQAASFKAQFDVTRACLQGTLSALSAAYSEGGLEAAASQLEQLVGSCRSS